MTFKAATNTSWLSPKYDAINGWTKRKIVKFIEENFKGKSINNGDDCLYRSKDGRKCAVGLFIPQSKYSQEMEGKGAPYVISNFDLAKDMPLPANAMNDLQDVHDNSDENETKIKMIEWVKQYVA